MISNKNKFQISNKQITLLTYTVRSETTNNTDKIVD